MKLTIAGIIIFLGIGIFSYSEINKVNSQADEILKLTNQLTLEKEEIQNLKAKEAESLKLNKEIEELLNQQKVILQ